MLIAAKILLSILTLGYSAATVLADFNKTHATNPLWTGHARFHLVWQVLSYNLIGLLVLILLWAPGPYELQRVWLAAILAACIYAAFFAALAGMRLYGGANYDENAYPPFNVRLPGGNRLLDMNTTVFTVQSVLLLLSFGLLLAAKG
jgi:hypothetical protein